MIRLLHRPHCLSSAFDRVHTAIDHLTGIRTKYQMCLTKKVGQGRSVTSVPSGRSKSIVGRSSEAPPESRLNFEREAVTDVAISLSQGVLPAMLTKEEGGRVPAEKSREARRGRRKGTK